MKFQIYKVINHLVVIIIFNFSLWASGQSLQILSYKSPAMSLSGDILLLVEDIIKNKWQDIEFLGTDNGIAYSRGGEYLLTKIAMDPQRILSGPIKSSEQKSLHYFESNRSFMVVSADAPNEFIEQLRSYKNHHSVFQDQQVYWNDLNWGQVKSGITENAKLQLYSFNKTNWKTSTQWNFTAYFSYKLKLKNQVFEITVLPKQFGGMTRVVAAIKKYENADSIVMSLGDITPPVEGAEDGDYEILDLLAKGTKVPHFILASGDEIIGYHQQQDYYKTQSERNKVHLISSNVYIMEGDEKKLAFKPYHIMNVKGKKIALIGLTAPRFNNTIEKFSARYPWLKSISIIEPKTYLESEMIPKLRKEVDLIVVLTNMTSEERAQYYDEIEGIDILIHGEDRFFGNEKKLTVDVKNFNLRSPRMSLLDIGASDMILNKTQIVFKDLDIKLSSQIEYIDQKYDLTDINTKFTQSFSDMIAAQDTALPDHRILYKDKIIASKEEFANLAAEIMRNKLHAEVGIFNIQVQQSTLPGIVDASVIKTWVRAHEQLVSGYLKGSDLIQLFNQNTQADKNFKLAFAGIDKKTMIAGMPINPNEYYRIATSSAVSENLSKFPIFRNLDKKSFDFVYSNNTYEEKIGGSPIRLVELLSNSLVENWKQKAQVSEAERHEYYRSLFEGTFEDAESKGYWAHDIKNVRIEYSQLKTTDISNFNSVQDSRLNLADQRVFSGRADYSAYYRRHSLLAETGLKAFYSKLEISSANNVKNSYIMGDDLVLFANLGLPIYEVRSIDWYAINSGPITELAYDSEFESDAGLPYQRKIQSFIGWKFYNGSWIRSSLVSLFNENRLSDSIKKNQWGLTFRFEVDKMILAETSNIKSQLDYKYYFNSDDDNQEDLRSRLIWDNYLDFKLTKNFSFGPFLKIGSFTGKVFSTTATQTTIGFNFNFSSFWKPKYQRIDF